jgi:hypothetical protein
MGGPPTKEYKEQLARQHLYEKQQAEKSRLKMIEYGKEFARIFKRHH